MDPKLLIRSLQKIPLFNGLTGKEILQLYDICRPRQVKRDEVLFYQGDPSDSMFILLGGELILTTDEAGDLFTLQSGQCFGEIGFITQQPRTATAKALANCPLLEINSMDFDRLLNTAPRTCAVVTLNVSANLSQHLIRMNQQQQHENVPIIESDDDLTHLLFGNF